MSASRKQLNEVLVSLLSRFLIILMYVLKALIIRNGVFLYNLVSMLHY